MKDPHQISQDDYLRKVLPLCVYHHLVGTIYELIPRYPEDTEGTIHVRNQAALAKVAAMVPANADEANIAVRCVLIGAEAEHILRLIHEHNGCPKLIARLTSQHAQMQSTARSTHRLLLRIQKARFKRAQTPGAAEADARTRRVVLSQLTAALNAMSAPAAPPSGPPPARPVAKAASRKRDLVTEAEEYSLYHPREAQLIRAFGGLPPDCDFDPPDAELVRALVAGTTPALVWVDRPPANA